MRITATFFRRFVPAMLLVSFALASCGQHKDCDPRPKKNGCGAPTSSTTKPSGNF